MLPWFALTTIHLGPIPIQIWGLFVALGMVVSIVMMRRIALRQHLLPDEIINLALMMMLGGIIGSRLVHVLLYAPAYYLAHPAEIIAIWHGGLSSFGGFVGAAIVFFISKKKFLSLLGEGKEGVLRIADTISFAGLYGWMVGRLGCVAIHDHAGMLCNCPLAFDWPGGARLDMAFLEIIGLVPLAVLFVVYRNKTTKPGWFTSVLFIYYGALRFVLDFFRASDLPGADVRYVGLTPGQYFGIVLAMIGVSLLSRLRKVDK